MCDEEKRDGGRKKSGWARVQEETGRGVRVMTLNGEILGGWTRGGQVLPGKKRVLKGVAGTEPKCGGEGFRRGSWSGALWHGRPGEREGEK